MAKRYSPIKEKPLRLPGQSINDTIYDIQTEEMLFPIVYTTMLLALSINTWMNWLSKNLVQPYLITLVTIIVIIYSIIRIKKARNKVALLRLGRDGERIVAEILEDLRKDGAAIFHDILGEGFNLDHVIICKHGIFVIETKTRSKFSDSKVFFDGKVLLVDGMRPERDPLIQATAEARWLHEQLQAMTGKKFPIRPVVVFPGWYVEKTKEGDRSEVWVLNPKGVPAFVRNAPMMISDEDVHLASYSLACMVRSRE
ncbi:MAG: NERD domain-containing protein [Anaerolineales bacterium]|nr:NERD domain-containing protein [Anaerolineales bacterium]